jgi:hypothetical protein
MIESDILRKTAADHSGKHHRNNVPDAHSNDSAPHISEPIHEGEEHSRIKEEIRPKQRRIPMKKRLASALTSLAISTVLIFGVTMRQIEAATIQGNIDSAAMLTNLITDSIRVGIGGNKVQAGIVLGSTRACNIQYDQASITLENIQANFVPDGDWIDGARA